jgi:hypothetical protein
MMSMPFNRLAVLCATTVLVAAGCSKTPERAISAIPTSPSSIAIALPDGSGVSHRALVGFPSRSDTLDFRQQLETKYATGLGRPASQTYVDMDGEVAWMQEYERYRVNGCDHDTATRNVMAEVDGAAPAPVCNPFYFPETAIYPSRDQVVDFRRQLGSKYQSMGRSAQSAVDPDGAAIWISEYLRYRTSGCDHPTAVQRTMTQIDGNPAPATCAVACAYYITPASVSAPAAGGVFSVQTLRTSGSCDWIAVSEAPWITVNRPFVGTDRGSVSFTVAENTGSARSGTMRVSYPGGASFFEVTQSARTGTLSFQFFDPATSTNATTECVLRSPSTICTLTAISANLAAPIATYDWRVDYTYNGSKVRTQVGALPTFSFTESCPTAASGATVIPLTARLTVTDTTGNSATITSGQGTQPALQLRAVPCQ